MIIAGVTVDAAVAFVVAEIRADMPPRLVTQWSILGGTREAGVDGLRRMLGVQGVTSVALEHPEETFPGVDVCTLPVSYELAWMLGREGMTIRRVAVRWREQLGTEREEQHTAAEAIAVGAFGESWPTRNEHAEPLACALMFWAHGLLPGKPFDEAGNVRPMVGDNPL